MRFGIWNGAAALLLAAALAGCAAENVNPVTGKTIYTPVSAETEAYYGQKFAKKLEADHGVYNDQALTAYVDRVGQALAKNVVRKDVHYTFIVLDDDDINGFSLPGGHVYITRGALNFLNSEAELAAMLGHEIGHIDAFHFNERKQDPIRGVLSVLLRDAGKNPDDLAMARKLAEGSAKSAVYSQAQEFEADALGIHYMTLAGYDPQAMLGALRDESAKEALDEAAIQGNPLARDILAMDQSHPATPERETRGVSAIEAEAAKDPALTPGNTPKTDRDAYLAAIDGMIFGADPHVGAVEGRRLVNAGMGFSFEAPEGFDLWAGHSGAFGLGRDAVLIVNATEGYTGQSLATYVQTSMLEKMTVGNVRPLEVEGYRGATGLINQGPFVIRLAALHDRGTHLYKVLYMAPRRTFGNLDAELLTSLKSFHSLAGAEATPEPALHLHIVTVASGDTVQSLSARMAVKEKKAEWFRVLNGLGAGDAVRAGDKVKLVEVE
jgi:predicted Zn-dependent protease